MKQIKYFVMALFAVLALASCDTDQEGPIYTPSTENVSLSSTAQSYKTDKSEIDIPVRFLRANKKGEYTAHYTFESDDENVLSDANNGTVTFADGEAEKTVVFHAANMAKGATYNATVSLSDDDIEKADTITNNAVFETTITVMCDYEWVDAGTAIFVDYIFAENGASAKGVKVQHAVTDEAHLYRLVHPYTSIYGPADKGGVSEADIKFYLDDNNNVIGFGATGIYDIFPGTGYQAYYDAKKYASYCSWSNEGDVFDANFLLLSSDNTLYGGGHFAFKWDGWPGNK